MKVYLVMVNNRPSKIFADLDDAEYYRLEKQKKWNLTEIITMCVEC